MPVYSPDGPQYRERVHQNGRPPDEVFTPDERFFRRYPKKFLHDGKPVPLTMQFEDDAGISANRSKYGEPQDVLEPDCCDGNLRSECVVLEILVSEIPVELPATDGRLFRFRPAHRPKTSCYGHSEIWCNEQGQTDQPHQKPPKDVRNVFRAALAKQLAKRNPLEFSPHRELRREG